MSYCATPPPLPLHQRRLLTANAQTDRLNRLADEIQAEINERARNNSLGNLPPTFLCLSHAAA